MRDGIGGRKGRVRPGKNGNLVTALDQYIRLEATGRWRETPGADWREVLVSFGNASLVLSDFNEHPLTHWSLAAVERIDPGGDLATYAPDPNSGELLEVRDGQMIEAIAATVAIARINETPKQRRWWPVLIGGAVATMVFVIAGVWGPNLLRQRALALVSQEQAELISGDVRDALGQPACRMPGGTTAMAILESRLGTDVSVMPWDRPRLAVLPDGTVLLSRTIVEGAASAEELAGWVALGRVTEKIASPLVRWIETRTLREVLGFLGTGEITERDIDWMAATLREGRLTVSLQLVADTVDALQGVEVNPAPFQMAVAPLVPANERAGVTAVEAAAGATLIDKDRDWVALQNICGS